MIISGSYAGEAARRSCIKPEGATEDCLDLAAISNFTIGICSIYVIYELIVFYYEYIHNKIGPDTLLDMLALQPAA